MVLPPSDGRGIINGGIVSRRRERKRDRVSDPKVFVSEFVLANALSVTTA